jgi:hypothetical protein
MAKGVRMDLLHLRPVEGLGNTIEGVPGRARLAYISKWWGTNGSQGWTGIDEEL